MTINRHLTKRIENGKAVNYIAIDGTKKVIPARLVTDYYTKEFCKAKKWTYTDGVNDGGIDAVTPKGTKKIQFKVLADNRSSVTFTNEKFNSKEDAINCDLEKMLNLLKDYAEHFTMLVIYVTTMRGDAFDKSKAQIYEGEDMVKWMYEHGDISYMNIGKQFYRQVKFSKRAKRVWA